MNTFEPPPGMQAVQTVTSVAKLNLLVLTYGWIHIKPH